MILLRRVLLLLMVIVLSSACSRTLSEGDKRVSRKITATDLRFGPGTSTPVISSAQKFILPVPKLVAGGEPLIYPKGHHKAGKLILDYEGKPMGEKGLVFLNAKDQSWQAVAGDGEGVIIINEVNQEQAEQLDKKVRELQMDPSQLTLEQLKQVLDFARNELKLSDMYNSTRSFVRTNMTPVLLDTAPNQEGKDQDYGLKKRDDRDVCEAIYIPGKFSFEGPAASPQVFENGGVIVQQEGKLRGVQPEIFLRTYQLQNGQPIGSLSNIAPWKP